MNALRDTADTAAIAATLRAAGSVYAEDEAALLVAEASTRAELERFVEERVAGVPLEHIVGWVEFRGLRVAVEPGVFVPRRRTEFLAELAAADAREGDVVVDLCCGSGAIGAVIAHEVPGADVYASDIDPVAAACARHNLPPERVFEGDLFDALPGHSPERSTCSSRTPPTCRRMLWRSCRAKPGCTSTSSRWTAATTDSTFIGASSKQQRRGWLPAGSC
ncbi:methyltransferase [Ruicaihuangia caeni]|uniref:methyltransferase n=1 Tax=Ruicaihuangia caeni TaxID=3042517 RepID=UPI00338E6AC3